MHPYRTTADGGASRKRFGTGLVVGKFSPLHRGHELVIETALGACERTLVISYSKPEFAGCERGVREAWLRSCCPGAEVLVIDDASLQQACAVAGIAVRVIPPNTACDEEQRQFVGWLLQRLLRTTVDAVFTSEAYGDGFAAALSAYFSAQLARAHPVVHVCVDPQRQRVPISGTAVRKDVHAAHAFLSPVVNASFVRRVCLLGGESTGKTTLAAALAERFGTVWVPEFGRERWEDRQGQLTFGDLTDIAEVQVASEEAALLQGTGYVFCDTSPLTTLFYSQELFGKASPRLRALACRGYDAVFLCSPDFPFEQDGTRQGEAFRQAQHVWYIQQLREREIPFYALHGDLEQRITSVGLTLGMSLDTPINP
jgi:NadR type nicotinamide-nucleotide adenylyltransferase